MQLKSSNIKSTVGRLSSTQVTKIGKQIGATGSIYDQRRAIESHIRDNHATATKAEGFLKKVGINRDKKEYTTVMSGLKGVSGGGSSLSSGKDQFHYDNLSEVAKKNMIHDAGRDRDLRDKYMKQMRLAGDERGAKRFAEKADDEAERFKDTMRRQSLSDRLMAEEKAGKDYQFGDKNKIGQSNYGVSSQTKSSNLETNQNNMQPPAPPAGFNNFSV